MSKYQELTEEERKKIIERQKEYNQKNKNQIKEKHREYYNRPEIKEKHLEDNRKNNEKNKEKINRMMNNKYHNEYKHDPKKRKKIGDSSYVFKDRHPQKHKENHSEYWKNQRRINKGFHLKSNLRVLTRGKIKAGLKRIQDNSPKIKQSKDYGIDYEKIIEYLSPIPLNLEDYDVHHKIPLASFDLFDKEGNPNLKEISEAFKPENHQLLTKEEHSKIGGGKNHPELVKYWREKLRK